MNTELNMRWLNWGPFVGRFKLEDSIIKRLHKDGKKELRSYHKSLAGHVKRQVHFNEDTTAWFYKCFQKYFDAYRQGHLEYHGLAKRDIKLTYDSLWINFMQAGDFNPLHTHGGDYSFVIFIDIPKVLKKEQDSFEGTSMVPGSLAFEYGTQARPNWASTGHWITPQNGDFFIFPALLQHWVVPYKTKCTRVSVSGNLTIINRHELPQNYF
tara:strand:+ start:79 stop:711 length:633 start_codon:yes stop_codon:yes gene_type:complete